MSDVAKEKKTERTSDPSQDRLIGEILANRYQIEERLGEGAMGSVYRARHVKVGRPFAVKVLHKKLLEDRKVAQRFEREAELAGRLRHPNVVGVVDVGETSDGLRYMVMDFAEGDDLATLLNEAPMKPERILHLTKQMLEGLYHAHEAGLIHRDFKPENVIVERDDHGAEIPRIVDFGIAILREGGESANATGRLTTNGLVLGTPHYMAPEQAVADPIDHRIDLFALGIVVYEMLSGKLPFDGTGAEVARANLLLDPPLISQRVPYLEADPLLEAFARRLMAKKRDLRPATAKAAREILDLIERDRPAAAAALGVPLVPGGRAPQITADVQPHRVVNEDSGNYMIEPDPTAHQHRAPSGPQPQFVAPAASAPTTPPRAADLEAPPVEKPKRSEAVMPTAPTQPLAWGDEPGQQGSRRGWIIAGIAAVGVAAAILVVVTRGGNDTSAAEPEQKVVMQATPPTEPSPSTDNPPSENVVAKTEEPKTEEPKTEEPKTEEPKTEEPKTEEPKTEEPKTEEPKTEAKIAKIKTGRPKKGGTKKDVASGAVTKPEKGSDTPKTEVKTEPAVAKTEVKPPDPVVKPPDPKPDQGVSSNALAAQYSAVGRDLKALGDKASDLWPKYRRIQLNDALSTPEKRSDASAILSQIAKAAANRK